MMLNNNNDVGDCGGDEPLVEITDCINRRPSLPKDRTSIFRTCHDTTNLTYRAAHNGTNGQSSQSRQGKHLKAFSSRDKQENQTDHAMITPRIFHDRITMTEHPTLKMSRLTSTDVVRQNINMQADFANDIESYLREREGRPQFDTSGCMERHEIKGGVRARMVDWMIEVLSNFHCDE